ncbi:MAG: acyltransferase [Marinifilaceae bacterium]
MQKQSNNILSNRIVWLDVLRFIAIFMVICIHCADPFNVSPEARANPDYNFFGALYGSFMRPCVPLFVMITGLLLLPVKQLQGEFYKKRLLRLAVPFVLWSVLYNLFPWITGVLGYPSTTISSVFAYASSDASQTFMSALDNILLIPFKFNVYTVPMWYLYMLLGLYLYMPFFSAWIEKASAAQKRFFLYTWGITLFLPYAYAFFTQDLLGVCAWNGFGTFYYFAGFNGYLLLGHYLYTDIERWKLGKTLFIAVPMFIVGYLITYFGFKAITANADCTEAQMELFFLYCSPNVCVMTIAVFLLARCINITSQFCVSLFANIAKCGLGIYLIHYFIVGIGYTISDALSLPVSLRIPISAVIVFLISWFIVAVCFKMSAKVAKWVFG